VDTYLWTAPKLYTNISDWENMYNIMDSIPKHIVDGLRVQVHLSGEVQLDVLSVYWDEDSGTLLVDVQNEQKN